VKVPKQKTRNEAHSSREVVRAFVPFVSFCSKIRSAAKVRQLSIARSRFGNCAAVIKGVFAVEDRAAIT
jgi:ligand-binding sensor protein